MKFMNEQEKTPHYIAYYTNYCFTRGLKQISEEEIDQRLTDIVKIFCRLHGRDTFIERYSSLLAQRLLNRTSVSDEAEQLMIKKLQVECGFNAVGKLKTMFVDIGKSKDIIRAFRK